MKRVAMYTDGACSGNPGPGGWCNILTYGGREKMSSGGEPHTTNNRMELTAVIEGLKKLKEPCIADVYTDSMYIVDAVNKGWIEKWRATDWTKASAKPLKNPDLWRELYALMEIHRTNFIYVKGHSGHEMNERCDREAVRQSALFTQTESSETDDNTKPLG